MFGTAIVVVCTVVLISHLTLQYQRTVAQRQRVLALTLARADLDRIRARAQAWSTPALAEAGLAALAMPRGLQRGVEYESLAGTSRHLRRVSVVITSATTAPRELARIASVMALPQVSYPATRVLDLYLLAIENLPGRGDTMAAVRARTEAGLDRIEERHPGLEFRRHWITRSSFGRDPDYIAEAPIALPGLSYATASVKGRIAAAFRPSRLPGELPAGMIYSLADRHNPAMRLPDELALHRHRVERIQRRHAAILRASALGAAVPTPLLDMSVEPSWRLLLEALIRSPGRYRDSILVNLHGDILPMPALLNRSIAARGPQSPHELAGLRCVTHPDRLHVQRHTGGVADQAVVLRVHAFTEAEASFEAPVICPSPYAVTLRLDGIDLTDPECPGRLLAAVKLENLAGGVPVTAAGATAPNYDYRPFTRAKDVYQPRGAGEMFYLAEFVDPGFGETKFTRLWLFHTPMICPAVRNSGTWSEDRWIDPVPGSVTRVLDLLELRPPASPSDTVRRDPARGQVQGYFGVSMARQYHPETSSRDLASPGNASKNTARWRLTLPATLLHAGRFVDRDGDHRDPGGDVTLRLETGFRDQDGDLVGTASTSYVWWSRSADAVPPTERAGFSAAAARVRVAEYAALLRTGLTRSRAVFVDTYRPGAESRLWLALGGETRDDELLLIERDTALGAADALGRGLDPTPLGAHRGLARIAELIESLANSPRLTEHLPPRVLLAAITPTGRVVKPRALVLRWDFADPAATVPGDLDYALLCSRDRGVTWFYPQDGALGQPGGRHAMHHCLAGITRPGRFVMLTPAGKFGAGPLIVRLEVWRRNRSQHYVYHTTEVEVVR